MKIHQLSRGGSNFRSSRNTELALAGPTAQNRKQWVSIGLSAMRFQNRIFKPLTLLKTAANLVSSLL